jgi:uncharacterized protein (DUF302 family)
MECCTTISTSLTFDAAVQTTPPPPREQRLDVLTEIDVKAALKNRLDEDSEPYLILGACNRQAVVSLTNPPELHPVADEARSV